MTIFPTRRLLGILGVWVAAAVVASAWVPLLAPLLGGLLVFLAVVGWDAQELARRPVVTVEREVPRRAVTGRPDAIAYRIRNPANTAVRIEMEDEWPPDLAEGAPHLEAVTIAARASREVRVPIRPHRRGDRPLGQLLLFEESPMRLLRRRNVIRNGKSLSVYPDARKLAKAAALDPRHLLNGAGLRTTRRRGQGSDFESLRDYVIGDDPRHIDWAGTARRGRLVTRLYRHERNHTVVLAVDRSRLMGTRCSDQRSKLDHAVDAALTLTLAALARGDRVEALLFDHDVRGHVAPRVHRGAVGPVVELLRRAEPTNVEANYQRLVGALLARRRSRALVVVLTDFSDAASADIEKPLRLLGRHHRTLLVALRDPLYSRLRIGANGNDRSPYERLAINELLHDRETVLARLRRSAVQSVDLPSEHIVASILNRYLEFRYVSV